MAVIEENSLPLGDGQVSNVAATSRPRCVLHPLALRCGGQRRGSIVILNPATEEIATVSVTLVEGSERRLLTEIEVDRASEPSSSTTSSVVIVRSS
ncbi:MAG: hypothetical protein R2695_03660 [Acidimicrobiales bacterium]